MTKIRSTFVGVGVEGLGRLRKDDMVRRKQVGGKLQRFGKAYVDEVYQEGDYVKEKRRLELELESLVVPEVNAAEDAGKLLQDLSRLWKQATLSD